jgi:FkbM family methyltransferase
MKDRQRFFATLLPKNAFVFDIGANYGEYTAAFFSLGARKVVAVEPQPDLAEFVASAFADEVQAGHLLVRAQAIGAQEGHATLFSAPDPHKSMATMSEAFIEAARQGGRTWNVAARTDVKVTTLDALIQTFGVPDYIKVDVEGFDLEVLKGLSFGIRLLSFEFNTQPGLIGVAERCIDRVCSLGAYEFNYQAEAPGQAALQFDKWVNGSVMRYTLLNDLRRDICQAHRAASDRCPALVLLCLKRGVLRRHLAGAFFIG